MTPALWLRPGALQESIFKRGLGESPISPPPLKKLQAEKEHVHAVKVRRAAAAPGRSKLVKPLPATHATLQSAMKRYDINALLTDGERDQMAKLEKLHDEDKL